MIIKIENESLAKSLLEMTNQIGRPDVKIFNTALEAFADAELDYRLDAINIPRTEVTGEVRKYAIKELHDYLANNEGAINYDGMDYIVREAIKEYNIKGEK